MSILRTTVIGFAILTLAACGGGGGGSSGGTEAPEPASATLSHVADCDALLAAIQTDARQKIAVQADEMRANGWLYAGGGVPSPVFSATPAAFPTAMPTPGGQAGPPTDTNTQVPGVDETDIVEIADTRIYLLRSDRLLMLRAVPPAETALVDEVGIEGFPLGMFVADGRALVVSSVYDDGTLGGDSPCGTIGGPFPVESQPSPVVCNSSFVKLTLLDVATTPARVVRELYVEGFHVASRRHGSRARVVVQRTWGTPPALPDPWMTIWAFGGPATEAEFVQRVDAWEERALAAIDASDLGDWLPAELERVNGALVKRALTCEEAAVPPAGATPLGATLVVGLDLADDATPPTDALLLGAPSQIYANADTLVLAQSEWNLGPFSDASTSTRTALHVFALPSETLATEYRGSGFVAGSVSSQFGLDVQGDVIRAVTQVGPAGNWGNATRVTTARIAGSAGLEILGTSADLAPGELLRGVRFLGDRAYLVTFLQVDPLFVVDLSDPSHPQMVGELELPGFSEYLHPLDDTHLLTIGRAATDDGRPLGVALRIFDVGDPTSPRQTAEYTLPIDTWSPAEFDHLSFTFDASRGLLALPVNSYGADPRATLELLAIDATAGISRRGTVDHGPVTFPPCTEFACPPADWMQRGLFIDDAVYSLSNLELEVHALDDLATPLATVTLP